MLALSGSAVGVSEMIVGFELSQWTHAAAAARRSARVLHAV